MPIELGHVPALASKVAIQAGIAYAVALSALYAYQDSLILRPGAKAEFVHAAAFAPVGTYLGDMHEPTGAAKGTIVFYHGNAGSVRGRGYAVDAALALGYRIVLVEYPGFGAREGQVTIKGLGARSIADFDLVRNRYPGQPLIVVGESFGAAMAAQVAGARADQVCNLVLLTPWNRLSSLVQEILPIAPAKLLLKDEYASDLALKAYPGPVTIVGSELDAVIPVHHAKLLAQQHAGSHLELVPGAGHNWFEYQGTSDWSRWLARGACGTRK